MLRMSLIQKFGMSPGIFQRFLLLVVFSLYATVTAAEERIFDAVKAGDLMALKTLIAEGVDVNAANKSGWTGLRAAFLLKKPEMLKALVAGGAQLDGEWILNETDCGRCHSKQIPGIAIAEGQYNAHLAGQHSEYIAKQLRDFVSGDRKHSTDSGRFDKARSLMIEEVIVAIAEYTQSLERYDNSQVPRTDLYDLGASVYTNKCANCHGENGIDTVDVGTPQLAGLFPLYTSNQINMFKDNVRANDKDRICSTSVSTLSDEEMQAVSGYISAM